MKSKGTKTHTESVLVLLLFAILAVCVLLVLMTGANAYRRLVKRGEEAYLVRTVPQYIATKIRKADTVNAVSVGKFAGGEALELTEWIEGSCYVTRIYCYDGFVRELFSLVGTEAEPEAGERIAKAKEILFSLEEGSLSVTVSQEEGNVTKQNLTLRCAEGGFVNEE